MSCPTIKANARNVSFRISLRWPIYIINPAEKNQTFVIILNTASCLLMVGISQAISRFRLHRFPPKGCFLYARNVPCACVGWVFGEVTGWLGVVRLVLVFCRSTEDRTREQVSICLPDVAFAACAIDTTDRTGFFYSRLNKLLIFLVCHKIIDMNRQSVRVFSLFLKPLLI